MRFLGVAGVAGLLALAACGDETASTASTTSTTSSTSGAGGATGQGGTTTSTSTSTGGGGGTGGHISYSGVSCKSTPPPDAAVPAPPEPYSGGTCPALAPGPNTIASGGVDRSFILVAPADLQPGERLPVAFLWHWLGGSATDFLDKGEVQAAVDEQRFLAVIPEAKGDLLFKWPFEVSQTQARIDEEIGFFDDMLACVSEQFEADLSCVSSVGVSAGALFTGVLAGRRADRLASMLSLSGGVEGVIQPWAHPQHHLPAIVLWGGPTDICVVVNFENASKSLEQALGDDGSFTLECVHNCGHTEPPFDTPAGLSKYAGLWEFVMAHPFWLPEGASPFVDDGVPASLPTWCAVGAGKATPRTGPCPAGGC